MAIEMTGGFFIVHFWVTGVFAACKLSTGATRDVTVLNHNDLSSCE